MRIIWLLSFIVSLLAFIYLCICIRNVDTVMQQCVVAAESIGYAVIPYCMARAIEKFVEMDLGGK